MIVFLLPEISIFNCTFHKMTKINLLTSDRTHIGCACLSYMTRYVVQSVFLKHLFLKHLSVVSHFDSCTVQLQIIVLSRIIVNEVSEVRLELRNKN